MIDMIPSRLSGCRAAESLGPFVLSTVRVLYCTYVGTLTSREEGKKAS